MSGVCPCCGQAVAEAATLILGEAGSRASRLGAVAKLTMSEATIVAILQRKYPEHATVEAIITGLYSRHEPEWPGSVVKAHVTHLRSKLAPLGIAIENVYAVGYRLAFRDAPIARRVA